MEDIEYRVQGFILGHTLFPCAVYPHTGYDNVRWKDQMFELDISAISGTYLECVV